MKKPAEFSRLFHLYSMLGMKYEYSSVHIDVPSHLAKDVIDWNFKNVPDDNVFFTYKNNQKIIGREDEIHITVLYGIRSEFPFESQDSLEGESPIHIKLGKVEMFTNPDNFDVVVINVISDELIQLNKKLKKDIPHTEKYGVYRPHITIAYIKKGTCRDVIGDSTWEGQEFDAKTFTFSSKNGSKFSLFI